MAVLLLDNTLKVEVFFDASDQDYDDDICICFTEDCPEDERLFRTEETNIYITPEQASLLVLALERAMKDYRASAQQP